MTEQNRLVGYARRSNGGATVRLSINVEEMKNCETYTTSDGQTYIPLVVSRHALELVLNGERAVTTVIQNTSASTE